MCTAQVLLLNRDVMRRNFGGDVNRRVCRKLFDSNEPTDAPMFLKKMQEEIRKSDTERWNFDFMTETPLPGRYQWEPVFAGTTSNKTQTTEERRNPIVEEIRREIPSTTQKRKRKQHKITEFLCKKKKHTTDESSTSKKLSRVGRNTASIATTTRLR